MTLRDSVWNETLKQLIKTGRFRISELPFDDSERHSVRRTLKQMEEMGWLARESNRAAIWRMGEMSKQHLNVSEEHIERAWS